MGLLHLGIERFRCIDSVQLDLDARFNLVSGDNASGKTSLLEAFYFLGRGRSFRTRRAETLIQSGTSEFLVTGRVASRAGPRPIGVRVDREGTEARLDGRPVAGLAELATVLPVQAIDPEVHRLIEDGPAERRRYLDWGVFHVEPGYVDTWRRFQRALRQRNAALKSAQRDEAVRAWDPELVASGLEVAERRQAYVVRLEEHVRELGQRLLGLEISLSHLRGWNADRDYVAALDGSWVRDRERGLTHVGPHRADLGVRVGGLLAKDRISRGQQKLLAAALLLGQLRSDAAAGSGIAALLVDDPAAELDLTSLGRLLAVISELPAQLVVTALDPQSVALLDVPEGHRFHVEHGKVTRLL